MPFEEFTRVAFGSDQLGVAARLDEAIDGTRKRRRSWTKLPELDLRRQP